MTMRAPAIIGLASTFLLMPTSGQTSLPTTGDLSRLYDRYHAAEITSRRFTQRQLVDWVRDAVDRGVVSADRVGLSSEGRPLTVYRYGTGSTTVLLWSQMHGDEPTATMALVDIIRLLAGAPDEPLVRLLRERLTVLMLPMLNPDGAERFSRRTAQRIDMNRDALRLVTPEAHALKSLRDSVRPMFGFNLHDQDPRYTVGTTNRMTAIALLAPPIDEARTDNAVRLRAKRIAARLATTLHEVVPGAVAKWDDAFEPRAFGDNVQRWGTSTILIESGGWPGDREKMTLRRANFIGLLSAMGSIATGSYEMQDVAPYEALPYNMKLGCDILFRRARLQASPDAPAVTVDIAINIDESTDASGAIVLKGTVVDIGDLSTFTAFEQYDLAEQTVDRELVKVDNVLTHDEVKSLIPRK